MHLNESADSTKIDIHLRAHAYRRAKDRLYQVQKQMDFSYTETSDNAPRLQPLARVKANLAGLLDKRAVRAQVSRGVEPESSWRQSLRAMCEDARADSVPPERLVVEVKQALNIMYDACAVPPGSERTEFTSRVVTLCIEEYYA